MSLLRRRIFAFLDARRARAYAIFEFVIDADAVHAC